MFAPGSVLVGRYRVDGLLGIGGYGWVRRARSLATNEDVAFKVLRADVDLDRETVKRFVREANTLARLTTEHAVRIRQVGTLENGSPFLVMELLHGEDLDKRLDHQGRFPAAVAVEYIRQVCDVLAEAH